MPVRDLDQKRRCERERGAGGATTLKLEALNVEGVCYRLRPPVVVCQLLMMLGTLPAEPKVAKCLSPNNWFCWMTQHSCHSEWERHHRIQHSQWLEVLQLQRSGLRRSLNASKLNWSFDVMFNHDTFTANPSPHLIKSLHCQNNSNCLLLSHSPNICFWWETPWESYITFWNSWAKAKTWKNSYLLYLVFLHSFVLRWGQL